MAALSNGDTSMQETDTAAAASPIKPRKARHQRLGAQGDEEKAKKRALAEASAGDEAQGGSSGLKAEARRRKRAAKTSAVYGPAAPADTGKGKAAAASAWPFIRLSSSQKSKALNPVFTLDARFCFVAAEASVKIYSVETCQLVSSLHCPGFTSSGALSITHISLHPSNHLQLVVTTNQGDVHLWDYLEGRLLRTLNVKAPIIRARTNPKAYPEHLFVYTGIGAEKKKQQKGGRSAPASTQNAIQKVSLQLDRPMVAQKVANVRDIIALEVSNDGEYLVMIARRQIQIVSLSDLTKGTPRREALLSFQGFPIHPSSSTIPEPTFVSLRIHPSEGYFVTGDSTGKIKFWYILRPDVLNQIKDNLEADADAGAYIAARRSFKAIPPNTTALVHWHAHACAALDFTPNGAYLLSGGEEAVIVMWHLSSSSMHKEFIPRLGGPIASLDIVVDSRTQQQEFVARLVDGSIVFVAATTLKISKTISGVKSLSLVSSQASKSTHLPIALEPHTNNLVFPASHASSLQFYSPRLARHVNELEVAAMNRVSRFDERDIEPVRVERVAFYAEPSNGRTWMATFDTWQDREYQRESHLKFWLRSSLPGSDSGTPSYAVNTRIDKPHGSHRLSSMAFSSATGLLATTSADGQIKLWAHRPPTEATVAYQPNGAWACLSSLSHRNLPAYEGAFSHDGSLLAVMHSGIVSLWDAPSGVLVKELVVGPTVQSSDASGSEQKSMHLCFAGKNGDKLAVSDGGRGGVRIWDVLSCEEIHNLLVRPQQLLAIIGSDLLYAVLPSEPASSPSSPSSRIVSLDLSTHSSTSRALGFSAREVIAYSDAAAHDAPTFAAIATTGEVVLTSPDETQLGSAVSELETQSPAGSSSSATAMASLPQSSAPRVGLFEEIFGTSAALPPSGARSQAASSGVPAPDKGKSRDVFDEYAPHNLPPLSSLWRGLLTSGLKPLPNASSSTSATKVKLEDGDSDSDSGSDNEMDGDRDMQVDVEPTSEDPNLEYGEREYVDSPEHLLKEIFAKQLSLGPTGNATMDGSGEPDTYMSLDAVAGGDASADKSRSKKDRKKDKKNKSKA